MKAYKRRNKSNSNSSSNTFLIAKAIGEDKRKRLIEKINSFIKDNQAVILEGAYRSPIATVFESDCYAPCRIQVNKTRLYLDKVKIVDGWHSHHDHVQFLTEDQIQNAVCDIQHLVDEGARIVECNLSISVKKK